MNQKLIFGCIADDFTGASDAASFLVKGGLNTVLFNGIPHQNEIPGHVQAAVIALKSRTQETSAAVADSLAALKWLQKNGAEHLYIKYCSTFDSTPAGNIGPICDAALELCGADYTLLCPSLPANKRRVEAGRLYVDGIPLSETHMSRHPLTPMWDSYIPELMREQSRYNCHVLPRGIMRQGKAAVASFIASRKSSESRFYLVPDYVNENDGELIVDLFGTMTLLSGGSGLLEPLAAMHAKGRGFDNTISSATKGKAIFLAGSCSVATQKQVAYFLKHLGKGIMLEPSKLLSGEQNVDNIWHEIEQNNDEQIIVYSSGSVGLKSDSSGEAESTILEDTLAALAKKASGAGYTRIIVAGGETSGAVTKALEVSAYQIGKSIAPGVPLMVPLSDSRIRLVLKSGNFGQEDFFRRALEITGGVKQ